VNYIRGKELLIPSIFDRFCEIWMMQLLFTIAGMSANYALQERSTITYIKERVSKLLVPLFFSMLTILPVMSYIAGLNYDKPNFFNYFTKLTDFTGYDGAFTPGHLWFILFLFVIAMVSLPLNLIYNKINKNVISNIPLILLMLMGALPFIGKSIFDINGKSPTEYLAYFLLGYFVLTKDAILKELKKYHLLLLGIFLVSMGISKYYNDFLLDVVCWFSVLTFLGIAQNYLNFSGKMTIYLSKASFGIYIFHLPWIVVVGYYVLKLTDQAWLQIPMILIGSIVLTFLTYETVRRVWILRCMFGLKK
jgi:peptidoglycan/LPS O-acetylase OafA/YrhL